MAYGKKMPKMKQPRPGGGAAPMSDSAAASKLPAFLKKGKKKSSVQSGGTGPGFSPTMD